jgi:hypothetical protein
MIAMLAMGLGACVPWYRYSSGPIHLKVTDEAGVPLQDVAVLAAWRTHTMVPELIPNISGHGGGGTSICESTASVKSGATGADGTVVLPGWTAGGQCKQMDGQFPEILVYKKGYTYLDLFNDFRLPRWTSESRSQWDGKTMVLKKLVPGTDEKSEMAAYNNLPGYLNRLMGVVIGGSSTHCFLEDARPAFESVMRGERQVEDGRMEGVSQGDIGTYPHGMRFLTPYNSNTGADGDLERRITQSQEHASACGDPRPYLDSLLMDVDGKPSEKAAP